VSTQCPKDACEKILQKCDVNCEIFSVEHFVTAAAAEAATAAAAAVIDDSNKENAQRCVSLKNVLTKLIKTMLEHRIFLLTKHTILRYFLQKDMRQMQII
jgi:hypothetical protein